MCRPTGLDYAIAMGKETFSSISYLVSYGVHVKEIYNPRNDEDINRSA